MHNFLLGQAVNSVPVANPACAHDFSEIFIATHLF